MKRVGDRLRLRGRWKVLAVVAVLCTTGYAIRRVIVDHESHSAVLASGTVHGKHWTLTATNDCLNDLCGMLCLWFNSNADDIQQGCGFGDCDGCLGVMISDTMDSLARRLVVGPAPKGTVKVAVASTCARGASAEADADSPYGPIVAEVGVHRLPGWAAHHGVWWMYETGPDECDIEPAYFLSASGKHLKFGSA